MLAFSASIVVWSAISVMRLVTDSISPISASSSSTCATVSSVDRSISSRAVAARLAAVRSFGDRRPLHQLVPDCVGGGALPRRSPRGPPVLPDGFECLRLCLCPVGHLCGRGFHAGAAVLNRVDVLRDRLARGVDGLAERPDLADGVFPLVEQVVVAVAIRAIDSASVSDDIRAVRSPSDRRP